MSRWTMVPPMEIAYMPVRDVRLTTTVARVLRQFPGEPERAVLRLRSEAYYWPGVQNPVCHPGSAGAGRLARKRAGGH
jgi:hypothetical protein